MVAKNFLNEEIPDFKDIVDIAKKKANRARTASFKFSDIYSYSESKGKYVLNKNLTIPDVELDVSKGKKENIDFKGLYILSFRNKVQYVGISKNVLVRIKQHFLSTNHFSASLAYLIAAKENNHIGQRKTLDFDPLGISVQKRMRKDWRISFIQESDNFHLHILEAYVACKFKAQWNTFKTH
ncbi:GIY-YIG nuclease family protein [Leptospira sp. FAT2]|uniref:GIY-YIG nuclease family protein n=1 Tax=Leptospira sanjuanensis TaxID=2879643 RepID=UPI001EE8D4F3|nr:GIY-YIG nuclease family protein [Leptospira sanjuanensis]MCG6192295.1 GIY-YIG nuclease family protein [Leptospira sanjuanensis]